MATQAQALPHENRQSEFERLVRGWDRRWRGRQALLWLPLSITPGLMLGIVLALISRIRPFLLSDQILMITGAAVVIGLVGTQLYVWLRPLPSIIAARRFDQLFGLQERVSTALELLAGRITSVDELMRPQLDDAWERARLVNPREKIPFILQWKAWAGLVVLGVALAILLLLPNPQAEAVSQNTAQQAAIEEATDDVRDITEEVAMDAALNEEEREELLETLETSTERLAEEQITPEEAFATMSEVETALEEQAQSLQERLAEQQ
ncbi:MAG: hypothetical protein H7175_28085, partial [Burkholderiales bacterium]|nr:hypothetical protein [Anaerolineae bacterium]